MTVARPTVKKRILASASMEAYITDVPDIRRVPGSESRTTPTQGENQALKRRR